MIQLCSTLSECGPVDYAVMAAMVVSGFWLPLAMTFLVLYPRG